MIKRQKNTYIVLTIVFIVFAIIFLVSAYVETTKYQDIDANVKSKKAELFDIQSRYQYLKEISVNSDKLIQNMELLSNRIGNSLDFSTVIRNVKNVVNGLAQIKSFEPGKIADLGDYKELKMTIQIETNFDSLRRLVYTIKYPSVTTYRCFRLDNLKYTMDVAGKVSATLEIVAFTYS